MTDKPDKRGKPAKPDPFAAELESLRRELDDRTHDLQRLTAEYANYRRRVERDRSLVAEQARGTVLADLLGVLDDIDRARDHGDLVGPFGAVAEQLVSVLTKLGLEPFAEAGDGFDPTRHEAVAHSVSTEVTEPTCVQVFRRGYQFGERLLRPALVAVADPSDEEPEPEVGTEEPATAAAPANQDEGAADVETAEAAGEAKAAEPTGEGVADGDTPEAAGEVAEPPGEDTEPAGEDAEPAGEDEADQPAGQDEAADEGEAADEAGGSAEDSDAEAVDADAVESEVIEGEVVDAEAAAVAEEDAEESGDAPETPAEPRTKS